MNIHRQGRAIFGVVVALALMALTCARATAQDVTVQGIIIGRSGANMILKTADAPKLVVVMNDDTQAKEVEGRLGMRKKELGITALVPGLPVRVKGSYDAQNRLVANTVEFKASDLKTAQRFRRVWLRPIRNSPRPSRRLTRMTRRSLQIRRRSRPTRSKPRSTNRKSCRRTNASLNWISTKLREPCRSTSGTAARSWSHSTSSS